MKDTGGPAFPRNHVPGTVTTDGEGRQADGDDTYKEIRKACDEKLANMKTFYESAAKRVQEHIDNGARLMEAADGWKESAQYFQQERNELKRELAALKRGEFICQKCSLRKDGEHDTPTEF